MSANGSYGTTPVGSDVLVVDDEPMVRDFIVRVLTQNGFTCRSAADAGEAIAQATGRPPTVAITDVRMPGKDGTWLLSELKKRWPDLPVLVLTAVSDAKQAVSCLKGGAYDYLVKPIDVEALLASVRRASENAHWKRDAEQQRRELEETVKNRTSRLRNALHVIEATYQDALSAVVNAHLSENGGPDAPFPELDSGTGSLRTPLIHPSLLPAVLGDGASIELSALRIAGKLIAEGASHLDVASALAKELVDEERLLCARLWAKRGSEQGLEAVVDVGGSALPGVALARQALSTGTTLWEEDGGITAVVSPIVVRGVAECALQLAWREEKRDDMRALTERLAMVLAASLSREHDARERQRTAEELEVFQKLAAASRYSLDLEHVAAFLMNSLHRLVDYDVAALLLLEDEPSLSVRARFPMDEEFAARVRSQIGNTLKLTCGVEVPRETDVRLNAEQDKTREAPHKLRSFVNVPLSVGGSVVGLIHVSSGREQAFSSEEVLFVHRAADFLASSVQGVRELLATVKGRVEQMVEHMTDGVLMLDSRGRVVAINEAARKVLGCSGDGESVDKSTLATLWDCDPMSLMRSERRSLRKLVCLRGVPYQAQLSPVADGEGQLVGTVLAFRDFEEEKRADEMKSELVNVVSHELRTPLTAIRNALTLLRGPRLGSLSAEQDRFVDLAKRNVDQLMGIINDLLDLSKAEAGKMHLDLEPLSMAGSLQSVLTSLQPQAEEKGLVLESSIAPDLPPIYGHAASLQRVIVNLVGNAIKFTERGGRVSVEAAIGDEGDVASCKGIRVSVADSGIGIRPEELESIFDRFHQVERQERITASGTGLGLPICRELVKAHHGRIWAESGPGRGSRFTFVIPVLSPRELLLRSLSTELVRSHKRDASTVIVVARLTHAGDAKATPDGGRSEDVANELLAIAQKTVRRSSDRVLWHRDEAEVVVVLPGTPRDGGRAFESRLFEEMKKLPLGDRGALRVAFVLYPDDGRSAEELYDLASKRIREHAVA